MTAIEKVLLRKDVASLIVAIVLGSAVSFFLFGITGPLASILTPTEQVSPESFAGHATVQAVVGFVLQVIMLELLLRLVIVVRKVAWRKEG